jgi:hypothetical protein
LPFDHQYLNKWLPLGGLFSGAPEIAYVLLWKPFKPHTQGLPLQHKSYKSLVRVTDWIPLPTGHPHWPLQTSTVSVVENYPSFGTVACGHCLVL